MKSLKFRKQFQRREKKLGKLTGDPFSPAGPGGPCGPLRPV